MSPEGWRDLHWEERMGVKDLRATRTSMLMLDDHTTSLDVLSTSIKRRSGVSISRTELIRGILEGILRSNALDFSQVRSEQDIAELVAGRLGRKKSPPRSKDNENLQAKILLAFMNGVALFNGEEVPWNVLRKYQMAARAVAGEIKGLAQKAAFSDFCHDYRLDEII